MVLVLLCVAQFVIVLDVTIVAIALPALRADLHVDPTVLGWVITGYTLAFGGCLLSAGRLADRAGRRRVFTGGLVLFAAASLAAGLAPNAGLLLAARALQGLGAALIAPSALALLTASTPERARPRALAWWTAAAAGGGASGWVLGGVLSGLLDWRWVFLVNVPVCLAAALLAPRVLPEHRDPRPARADLAGAIVATAGLTALVYGLTVTWPALLLAAALLAAFPVVERRAADPLLDLPALRARGAIPPNLVALALTATTTPPMFLCTLLAQEQLGLGPVEAGLLFPPFNLAVVAGSLLGPRVPRRRAMAGGLLAIAAGAVLLCGATVGALLAGFALMGAGLGLASVASTSAGTEAIDARHQGVASGLLNTSAQVGTTLGLAVIVPLAAAHADYRLGFTLAAAGAVGAAGVFALAFGDGTSARPAASSGSRRPARSSRAQCG
jgi:MFS family permease